MAEITKELGRIPVSRGDYQATVEYYKDNIVQYKRGSYQVVSESPIIGVSPTNNKNVVNPGWTLFAGTLDAQDVVNQIKEQEAQSIQAVANREAEILAKSDASNISYTDDKKLNVVNIQDAINKAVDLATGIQTIKITPSVPAWENGIQELYILPKYVELCDKIHILVSGDSFYLDFTIGDLTERFWAITTIKEGDIQSIKIAHIYNHDLPITIDEIVGYIIFSDANSVKEYQHGILGYTVDINIATSRSIQLSINHLLLGISNNSITTEKIVNNSITTEKIVNNSITTEKIVNNSITWNKLNNSLKILSENLFNYKTIENGYINPTGNVVILEDQPGWRHSDWIPVIEGTTYFFKNFGSGFSKGRDHAFYDVNKNFISYGGIFSELTAPSNAAFLRFSWYLTNDGPIDLVTLSARELIDFVPYKSTFNPDYIPIQNPEDFPKESITFDKLNINPKFIENVDVPEWENGIKELYLYPKYTTYGYDHIHILVNSRRLYFDATKNGNQEQWLAQTSSEVNDVVTPLIVKTVYASETVVKVGDIVGYVVFKDAESVLSASYGRLGRYANLQFITKDFFQPKIAASFNKIIIPADSIPANSITLTNLSPECKEESNNLFNKDVIVNGYYINGTSDGSLAPAPDGQENWWTSDFISIKPNTIYSISNMFKWAFYDGNKNYIIGSDDNVINHSFITPSNAKYFRFSNLYAKASYVMFNKGHNVLSYEEYYLSLSTEILKAIVEQGPNKFNKNTITSGYYVNSTGNLTKAPTEQETWQASDWIPVRENKYYTIHQYGFGDSRGRDYVFADDIGNILLYKSTIWETVQAPIGATKFRFSRYAIQDGSEDTIMLVEGQAAPTQYTAYKYFIREDMLPNTTYNDIKISLPNKIYAVIGDTLQLFYRGMIQAKDPYHYDILPVSQVGKMYPRYFEYTPVNGNEGNFDFKLYVKDDNGNVLGVKNCIITVGNPIQPTTEINVACFGDSLTSSGTWCHEAHRRLTESDGNPIGLGFSNINFVGSKKNGNTGFFGVGGWQWTDYTTKGRTAFRFFVSSNINVSRGSVYTDGQQNYTISEVNLDAGNILGDAPYGTTIEPTESGTLTKVSGNGDSTISYSSYSQASQNPLWNYEENRMDFIPYANKYCNGRIDVVYTLLSWNGQTAWKDDFSSVIAEVKKFADALHRDFPNAKMKLMGIQLPDIHGGEGNIEGSTGLAYADQYGILVTALNQNEAYQEFANRAEYKDFVEFVNVSSQFDSDYNMPVYSKPVNNRCSRTEEIGTNDVHPNNDGYMQIADVVYRNFVVNYCK